LPNVTVELCWPEAKVCELSQFAAVTGMPEPVFGVEQFQPDCWTSRTA
jgi:hypothetical protein